jgi:SAM-dependent methyltransferase
MEQTVCLLCGARDERLLLRRAEPRHVVCRRCGLVYQNPRPTLAEISAYYREGYWEDRGAVAESGELSQSDASLERGRAILDWARSRVGPADLTVEIGCGHGEILAYLRDQLGCQALGVEPSRAQATAAARFGLEILNADLEGVDLRGRRAKLLVLSHVLEHFHDPRAALARCRELLADDGWLFIEVPNILNPNPRKRLSTWLAVEHMYYYSVGTLSRLLAEGGFRVTKMHDKTFVRVLAQPAAVPATRPAVESLPGNEYRQVLRALAWHDLRYWPWYFVQRVGSLFGNSKSGAAQPVVPNR